MAKKRRKTNQRGQKIILIVCLSFLFGIAFGALMANLVGNGVKSELVNMLSSGKVTEEAVTFLSVFVKYLKYDFLIWIGGWMGMGLFLSGAAFLLRSMSLGFASAMMMMTYGGNGVLKAMVSFLPSNLILIPGYIFIMCAAIFYMFSWKENDGKRALRREKKRKQTEYCILFGVSVLIMAAGAGVEFLFYAA